MHEKEFGRIRNCVVHYDESTPHIHVVSVPTVERNGGYALCVREMIPRKQKLDSFHDHLYTKVGIKYNLDRGQRSDSRFKETHVDMYRYKLACIQDKITVVVNNLEKLHADIEKAGSIKELFSWAIDISNRIDMIVDSLGGCSIDSLQISIEAKDILLEQSIISTGFQIHAIEGDKYCCIDCSCRYHSCPVPPILCQWFPSFFIYSFALL